MGTVKKYVVVKFLEEFDDQGRPVVDLVARKWLSGARIDEDGQQLWNCAYPPKPFFNFIAMVKTQQNPDLTWKEYISVILGSSDKYEEGKTFLVRAQQKLSVSTTEVDSDVEADDESDERVTNPHLDDAPKFPDKVSKGAPKDRDRDWTPPSSPPSGKKAPPKRPALSELPPNTASKSSKKTPSSNPGSSQNTPKENSALPKNASLSHKGWTGGAPQAVADSGALAFQRDEGAFQHDEGDFQHDEGMDQPGMDFFFTSPRPLSSLNGGDDEEPGSPSAADQQVSEQRSSSSGGGLGNRTPTPTGTPRWRSQGSGLLVNPLNRSSNDSSDVGTIIRYLQGMEGRIMTEMKKYKRSLYHDVAKVGNAVAVVQACINDHFKSPNGNPSAWTNIRDFEDTFCEIRPFPEMEHFNIFMVALEDKETSAKFTSVLESLWVPVGRKQTLTKSVLSILERYLSRAVALLFSGQGKGKAKKENFSATIFYRILEGVVLKEVPDASVDDVKKAVGKCLAGAKDWEGGRAERSTKSADETD